MEQFTSPVVKSEARYFREQDVALKYVQIVCSEGSRNDEDDTTDEVLKRINKAADALIEILEKYQEQPAILDPSLESIVLPIMSRVRQSTRDQAAQRADSIARRSGSESSVAFPFQCTCSPILHTLFRVLYAISKVRGYKRIVRLLPHEVADLEPALWLLLSQDRGDHGKWQTRYSLLLWLSMLVVVPFDLHTIDSTLQSSTVNVKAGMSSSGGSTLVDDIIEVCKGYLSDPGPSRSVSALCLSKLLMRPDMEGRYLTNFLNWANGVVAGSVPRKFYGDDKASAGASISSNPSTNLDSIDPHSGIFLATGALDTLVRVFKHGHRNQLEGRIPLVAECLERAGEAATSGKSSTLQRKLTMKLSQRIGLQYLPPRVVSWRYQRGQRSLLENLGRAATDGTSSQNTGASGAEENVGRGNGGEEEDDEDDDVPEEMDAVIELLLCGLRDKDTVVRWSAAKGIGRVTGRLPEDFADDVVGEVLNLFSEGEGDGAWHGGCLALAELARRGLLLPERLGQVVPLVTRAIVYDVRKGKHSIGSHVRDAACYVCWAFARAYEPSVMADHVMNLARSMLITAVFDREVNCRRAASAAFQENVGRQGHENFKHGIDILTKTDYFTLGNRTKAYLEVAPFVGQFEEYRKELLNHLANDKIAHWDQSIRELTAKALAKLTPLDPIYVINELLPSMLGANGALHRTDLMRRHGSTLSAAKIIIACGKLGAKIPEQVLKDIRNTIPRMEKARLYRGRGGEIMRGAACELLRAIAEAKHPLTTRAQLRFLDTIDECLKHPTVAISESAVAALKSISKSYCSDTGDGSMEERLPLRYCEYLRTDDNPGARRGYALALGALPRPLVSSPSTLQLIVGSLCDSAKDKGPGMKDAETRRNSVRALGELCSEAGDDLTYDQAKNILQVIHDAMEDYSTDSRGAVGSWVRKAGMKSLPVVLTTTVKKIGDASPEIATDMIKRAVGAVLSQAAGKMDSLRDSAASSMRTILASPLLSDIPERSALEFVFLDKDRESNNTAPKVTNWSLTASACSRICPLLSSELYCGSVLSGLITICGDINESNAKLARAELLRWIKDRESFQNPGLLAAEFLGCIKRRVPREFSPLMKTSSFVIKHGAFDSLEPHEFFTSFLSEAKKTTITTQHPKRTLAGMDLMTSLLTQEGETAREALQVLVTLVGHGFPTIRKRAATELYTSLLTYDEDLLPEGYDNSCLEEINNLLEEVDWLLIEYDEALGHCEKLYTLFGLPQLTPDEKAQMRKSRELASGRFQSQNDDGDDEEGYMALVNEMHRNF